MGTTNLANLAAELGLRGFLQGEELRCRCPFHSDQNPSFSLNTETGLWICFSGCGSGDFTQLVERMQSVNFNEAKEWIASNGRRASVDTLSRSLALSLGQNPGQVYTVQSTAWREHYYSLSNKVIPAWFINRGFNWKTVTHWEIRYDPIQDAVVIPVKWEGELVGTITRPFQGQPKYKNSPNLPRNEIFFGEISKAVGHIILTEGSLDCIWAWQNGFNCVALLGTTLSSTQIGILRKYRYGEIVLALDNDDAGHKGTVELHDKLIKAGWLMPQITTVRFPIGKKDANDCEPELLKELIAARKSEIW